MLPILVAVTFFLSNTNSVADTPNPKEYWKLVYVDSEEVVGADGAAEKRF